MDDEYLINRKLINAIYCVLVAKSLLLGGCGGYGASFGQGVLSGAAPWGAEERYFEIDLSDGADLYAEVKVGSDVIVGTTSNDIYQFTVEDISEAVISGGGHEIKFEQIESIFVRTPKSCTEDECK